MSSIPETMRAAVVTEFKKPLEYKDVPVPKPGNGQVLVKMICSGVCHTDLHCAHGDWPVKPTLPIIPGHEGVGEVVQLGPNVENVKLGDWVGIPWLGTACGHCEHCMQSWETLCTEQKNSGYAIDGSFAEYAVTDATFCGKVPKHADPYQIAPIICAGVTVYKGLKMTEARPGQWVAISGCGGLGHIAIQYAKAMGMRVIGIDVSDDKSRLALEMGAEVAVNCLTENLKEKVDAATGGLGCHGVLVTAVSPKAFSAALSIIRRGGTMVLNGLPPGTFDLDIFSMVLNGITVRGSIVGNRQDLKESIDFAADNFVKSKITIEPFEPNTINTTFDRMEKGAIDGRIVVDFTGKY